MRTGRAAQAELAEKKAFLAGLEKAFKEAEESYNRISRRVSDAQARLEALRGRMAEKDAEGRESAGEEIAGRETAEEDRDPAKGPDTMLPGGMDVRTAMEHLEARMQENRQHQSEARERLTGLEQEKSRLHHRLETNRMARERISGNRRRLWKRYKRNGHGSRHFPIQRQVKWGKEKSLWKRMRRWHILSVSLPGQIPGSWS